MGFAGGIPIAGYIVGMESISQLSNIWIMLISTSIIGWHILEFNDACFPSKTVPTSRLFITVLLPVVSFFIAMNHGYFKAAVCLLLMIFNWHLYSFLFKGFFPMSLVHNFCGGFLHFSVGTLFSSLEPQLPVPHGLYFGLMMTGASMQHDALDFEEDKRAGYKTGAVCFGRETWWRLGIIPLISANVILLTQGSMFSYILVAAFVIYTAFYCHFYRGNLEHKDLQFFRTVSRVIYGSAGTLFIGLRIVQLRGG